MANMLDAIIIVTGGIFQIPAVEEAKKSLKYTDALIGINNRNLKTLKTEINTTYDIYDVLVNHPSPLISESGIKKKEELFIYLSENNKFVLKFDFLKQNQK